MNGILCIENDNLVFKLQEGEPVERVVNLKKGVEHLSFEFLTNGDHGVRSFSTWGKNDSFSPSFVKITLNHSEDYVFWVNQSNEGIPFKTKINGEI